MVTEDVTPLATDDRPAAPARADDLAAVLGPARLAFFTPVFEQPTLADRKAMFILGASGLMATVLLFFSQSLQALARGAGRPATVALVAAVVCVVVLVLAAAFTAYAAYRLPLPAMPTTLALFREVSVRDPDAYASAMYALTHRQAMRNILHYNYSVATQAAGKFRLVNQAIRCLRVAIPLWMLLLLALAVWG